ncbi:MAG TPA: TolC family protein [Candidatus Binatia bacterium]|nr:TolC family protein [Candidatus Binatia bacterium]
MSSRTLLSGTLLALCLAAAVPIRAAAQTAVLDSLQSRPTLDLDLLERAILERNSSLGAMRAAWRGGEAAADQAGGLDDPVLEIMTAPRSWSGSGVDPAYMAALSQRLPLFGQRGLEKRAARAGARALGEDYRGARLDVLREARRAYYESYLAARGHAVNAEIKNLLGEVRRTAVGRYAAGTVGIEDALQADVEIAMLDHEDVEWTRQQRVAAATLNALLQRDPGAPLPEPPDEIVLPPVPARSDSLLALALASRPELMSWGAQRDARTAELSLARRQRLPELTVTARYDRYWEIPELRPSAGISLNVPIQFGRLGASERAARAGVEQMELRRKAAQAQIGAEVETALAGVQETDHEIHIMRERVVPTTERALRAVRASYESSRAAFAALLNAERDLARARFELYRAQVGYMQGLADLDRAVGSTPAGEEAR